MFNFIELLQEQAGLLFLSFGVFFLLMIAVGFFTFFFWIRMLIDATTHEFENPEGRLVWILILIFLGVFGAFLYYFVIKKQTK